MRAIRAVLWLVLGLLPLLIFARVLLESSVLVMALAWARWQHISLELSLRQISTDPLPLGLAQLIALGSASWLAWRALSIRPGAGPVPLWFDATRRPSSWIRDAVLAVLLGIALQFPLMELSVRLGELLPFFARDPAVEAAIAELTRLDPPIRVLTVPLAISVIAPLTEELLFRGILLLYAGVGPGTLVMSSVAFGVFHGEPAAMAYATLAGFVLGGVAIRTRSIVPSALCHAAFNSVPMVLVAAGLDGLTERVPLWLVLASTVVAITSGIALYVTTSRAVSPIDVSQASRTPPRS